MEEAIKTGEAARLLGISPKTVNRYIRAGLLKAEPERRGLLGRYRWKIERGSIEKLIEQTKEQDDAALHHGRT